MTDAARLAQEIEEARAALGAWSKHEIGQSLKGAINNLRQAEMTARENAEYAMERLAALRAVLAPVLALAERAELVHDLPLYLTCETKGDFNARAWNRYSRGTFKVTHPDPLKRQAYGEAFVALVNALPALRAAVEEPTK